MTSINRFLYMYRHDALMDDATWRAYDFAAAVKSRHVQRALKQLGLAYAGELGVPHFMALYEVPEREQAEALLGQWWLWREASRGAHPKVPKRGQEGVSGANPTSSTERPA